MQRRYVTSMSRSMFDDYGKDMLEGMVKYWPNGEIWCYSEDELPEVAGVIRKSVFDVPGAEQFIKFTGTYPALCGIVGNERYYTRDVHSFSKKVFSIMGAAVDFPGYLFWVDADVQTFNHIPAVRLDDWMSGKFMCVLKRKTWHMCSSFVGFDCSHAFANGVFNHWYHVYMSGSVFLLQQWDDAFVLEQVILKIPGVRDLGEDFTGEGPYNIFDMVFSGHARHLKGQLKLAMRYEQLNEIVRQLQPKKVIEVGTWNGLRAVQLAQLSPGMEYVGFDLFEDATADTDAAEKNVKRHCSLSEVAQTLEKAGVKFSLHKGDSKVTFPQYLERNPSKADLVFIDGGHSVETIRADLESARKAVKEGGLIVLDDYYTEMPESELQKFGCQAVLSGIEHDVLPVKDSVNKGGKVQMAVVRC